MTSSIRRLIMLRFFDGRSLYGNLLTYRFAIFLKDNNKAIIGQSVNDDDHPLGYAMDDGDLYSFTSKLPNPLITTGEHENDYVQFTYGTLSWPCDTPNGGALCTVGGYDPRDGLICGLSFGNLNAVCLSFPFFLAFS